MARHGVPRHITLDWGPQFTSSLWASVVSHLGSDHHLTSAYHPQANILVERLQRTLKAALQARLKNNTWTDQLPRVLLGMHLTPKLDIGCSPADLVFCHSPLIPDELIARLPSCPKLPTSTHHHPNAQPPPSSGLSSTRTLIVLRFALPIGGPSMCWSIMRRRTFWTFGANARLCLLTGLRGPACLRSFLWALCPSQLCLALLMIFFHPVFA